MALLFCKEEGGVLKGWYSDFKNLMERGGFINFSFLMVCAIRQAINLVAYIFAYSVNSHDYIFLQ